MRVDSSPTPGFCAKSAQSIENKRVEFLENAKKCKRVRKRVKKKGIVGSEWWVAKKGILPPHYMHDYQKKGLIKWAIRK